MVGQNPGSSPGQGGAVLGSQPSEAPPAGPLLSSPPGPAPSSPGGQTHRGLQPDPHKGEQLQVTSNTPPPPGVQTGLGFQVQWNVKGGASTCSSWGTKSTGGTVCSFKMAFK